MTPTPKNGVERSAAHAQSSSDLMATFCWAKIKSNDKVNRSYEANRNDGVEKSSARAQFESVLMTTCCSAKIKANDKVDCNAEANSNNGFGRSGAHAQVSRVTEAISCSCACSSLMKESTTVAKPTLIMASRGVVYMLSFKVCS